MMIYISTKSKLKTKKKPGWEKAKAEHDVWLKKHGIDPSKKKRKVTIGNDKSPVVVSGIYRRETPNYPSLNTLQGSTARPEKKVYTGDKLLGIAAMHKSNLVPIFSDDEAKDVSTMRRG